MVACAADASSSPVRTFSVGFDDMGKLDELPQARRVARHFGTHHEELHVGTSDLVAVVRALANAHGDPFADAANVPLYLLAKRVRDDVKVILQGDGGDEMFAGYRRYTLVGAGNAVLAAARLATALERRGGRPLLPRRLSRLVGALGQRDEGMLLGLMLTTDTLLAPPSKLLSPTIRSRLAETDPFIRYRELAREYRALDRVQRMLYTDVACLLPDTFLEKVDRSTMAQGVETRVPFLDNDLAEFAMRLPSALKVSGGAKKRVLRAALRGVVPDWILDAPKRGFNVPYGKWLRGPLLPLLKSTVCSGTGSAAQWFDLPVAVRLVEEHATGARDHALLLWKALQLGLWAESMRA
jgi:asparagine synthase (glutamine-hydrolysing)